MPITMKSSSLIRAALRSMSEIAREAAHAAADYSDAEKKEYSTSTRPTHAIEHYSDAENKNIVERSTALLEEMREASFEMGEKTKSSCHQERILSTRAVFHRYLYFVLNEMRDLEKLLPTLEEYKKITEQDIPLDEKIKQIEQFFQDPELVPDLKIVP